MSRTAETVEVTAPRPAGPGVVSAPIPRWRCGATIRVFIDVASSGEGQVPPTAARSTVSRRARRSTRIDGRSSRRAGSRRADDAQPRHRAAVDRRRGDERALLATLKPRGEALTVAALPWVAPVYGAMPQVGAVIELPFAHGRLNWRARVRLARTLRHEGASTSPVLLNSIKAALVPWLARIPRRVGLAPARALGAAQPAAGQPRRPPADGRVVIYGARQRRRAASGRA